MANTLIPIQTYTLTGTAASVTFSNIPQNYTDLKLVASVRDSSSTGGNWNGYSFTLYPNGLSTNITQRSVFGTGSSTGTTYSDSQMYIATNMSADTTGVFGSAEIYIANYSQSVNKGFVIDSVGENMGAAGQRMAAAVWASTSAITSLQLNAYSTFTAGSTFTLYGISNGVKATGGTLTVAGGYAYHTFTSTGSFLPNQQIKGAEVLIVAGGGGGGELNGGGGAGGVVYGNSQTLNAGNSYTAIVGSGGTGAVGYGTTSGDGTNSVFSLATAIGGGGCTGGQGNGRPGGSGGGAGNGTRTGGSSTQVSYTNFTGYGNAGGNTGTGGGNGGGGGAGAAGATGNTTGGNGGVGLATWSTWHSVTSTGQNVSGVYYIAGGGGGGGDTQLGANTAGSGGYGGGGVGSAGGAGVGATANTGGGGGGGGRTSGTTYQGGNGGSGLVIVRYPLS